MSSTPNALNQYHVGEDRRSCPRKTLRQLFYYADSDPDNGGTVTNLGEGGLRFHGFRIVNKDQLIRLSFRLPGTNTHIEASGQVIWTDDTKKGGGLRFVDLSGDMRRLVNEWAANEAPSEGAPTARLAIHSGTPHAIATSERHLISYSATLDKSIQPKIEPKPAESPASEPRQISPPPPETENVGRNVSALAAHRFPPETRESVPQNAPPRQYFVFAGGVLVGCAVVLTAIAGLRMLDTRGGSTTPAPAQSVAGQLRPDSGSLNSPVGGTSLNNGRPSASGGSLDGIPPVSQALLGRAQPTARSGSTSSDAGAARSRDGSEKKTTDQPSLALHAPHMPIAPSKAEVREPSIADGVLPGSSPLADPQPLTTNRSDPPKLPQLPRDTVGRSANYVEAVAIEHPAPAYPSWARATHLEGTVKVNATVGTDGVPRGLKLVSGDSRLAQPAMAAISHWRYVPAVSSGIPVESQVIIIINFQFQP